ncbi:NADPH:quinone oxidoreductase family protein [Rhodotorula paludigena]|uniref:NADPH:quinone oxidoreductase family protein n=1 Tax=Rhodotorula paludigena TaxID=86838 RepID=UPI00317E69F7
MWSDLPLQSLKAFVIEQYIRPEELPSRLLEWDEPKPSPDEIVVDVHYAGLNFFDILQVQGKYQNKPPFPWIAGCEFSGVVSATSPIPQGCPFVPGQTRVFGAGQGAYAEKIKVAWRTVIEVPKEMGLDEAAGLYITAPTSYAALVTRAKTQKGEWVLVHAAAGGVGLAAVQIAKTLGARVIATAGSAAKLEVAKRFGADYGVDYTKDGWQKEVLKITGGHGADVVYDPVGMIVPSLKCIAWNGRLLVVGFAAGSIEKIPANLLLLKNVAAVGVHWGAYTKNEPAVIGETWAALLELFRTRKLVGAVFGKVFDGLESVPEGLRALGGRETWGKAVVKIKGGREGKL